MPSLHPIVLREPCLDDGMAVFRLIARCPPLDTNSSYCNMLQCGHFSASSVAALTGDELVGFISAYPVPSRSDSLFIWQVAVDEPARGQGLALQMLLQIVKRDSSKSFRYLETTITADNRASWSLFERLAKHLGAELNSGPWLDQDRHFDGQHPSELLVRIGPFEF